MRLARRKFLHLTAGVTALAGSSRLRAAETDFPNRPVRLIIGYPAGIQPDVIARIVAPAIGEQLGQPVVVENRPGAGTNLGTEFVVRATADGYTLLLVPVATAAANATLYLKLKFNFIRDIMPVASIGGSPLVLWRLRRCRQRPFRNSSPMRNHIRPKSTWRRPASALRPILPASCST
jgi:tripartite-type tricarboxylate transporter receptor subunit TctC